MVKKILFSIAMRCPAKIIHEEKKPYLERYFLFNFFGLRFYLHRFVASDPDRGLHSHPWPWAISFILISEYLEILEKKFRIIRWVNLIKGDTFHRVQLSKTMEGKEIEVWTLFIHPNNYFKDWGFMRPDEDGNIKYFPWVSRNRKNGEKETEWEKTAPLGKEFLRDENKIAIVE